MAMKMNIGRLRWFTPYSLGTIFGMLDSITISKIPMLLARVTGSIVGVTLLIWFGLFVAFLLADSSTPLGLLAWLASSPSHTHLTILFLAAGIVSIRIDPLFQVLLLFASMMNLWAVLSPTP